MSRRISAFACCVVTAVLLLGCGPSSKEDIVAKARDAKTRAALEQALGKPDDIGKLGPIEKWTYKAKNGKVTFILMGDTVTIEKTDDADKKN
jgi:hypothetical protein